MENEKSLFKKERLILNVGGLRHEIMMSKLANVPISRLGKIAVANTQEEILSLCDAFSIEDNEIFFDRDPKSFNSILNFYRTGKFGLTDEECVMAFRDELEFWMLAEQLIDEIKTEVNTWTWKIVEEENWGNICNCGGLIGLWNLMENPHSSKAAMFISCLSITFIVTSIIGMLLNTVPEIQHRDYSGRLLGNPTLSILETVCVVWFTLEFLVRFVASPNKCTFMKGLLNWIDLLAILPYFISLFVVNSSTFTFEEHQAWNIEISLVFRILRLLRIFKFVRNSVGLQTLGMTLKSIWKEICMTGLLFSMGVLLFSTLGYYAEMNEPDSMFVSIPGSFWWAIITMTTVGYGDVTPVTCFGKIIAAICAVSGLFIMASNITIFVTKYTVIYQNQIKIEESARSKEKLLKTSEKELTEKLPC